MEDRLQHQPTAHEPQRAHTNRVRSTPQAGAKLEQTLLMNEGKLGSRSRARADLANALSGAIVHRQNTTAGIWNADMATKTVENPPTKVKPKATPKTTPKT